MPIRTRSRIAALLASTAAGVVLAQAAAPTDAPAPNPQAAPAPAFVNEPIASTSGGAGPGAELASGIAQALNADPALKQSKFTVVPDGDVIVMRGVTQTLAQMARAITVATEQAGEGKVVNAIYPEEMFVDVGVQAPPAEVAEEPAANAQAGG